LIQGKASIIAELTQNPDVLLYWGASDTVIHAPKAPLAAAILAGMVGLAALNLTSMVVLSAAAAFLMVASGCLSLRLAMQAVSSSIVLLIAATLALGEALQVTGAAHWMAESLVILSAGQDPWIIMALFGLLVTILTNVISNNATAVIMAPIAFGIADTLGVSPMPFLMAVIFGANAAFATPISYKTNLLVMSVGEYRFGDFLKAGLILNIMAWLLVSLMIPLFWSF
jgi:di/tricarboxylate transporter